VQASSGGISRGMEFVVRLPIMRAAGSPLQAQPAAEPTSAAARRILVVDDNLDAAESLSQLLQINGHETRLAHDGVAAVEQAALFQPHVVLLDIGLPRLNGYDAARQIRQGVAGRSMLLVALTGWGQQEDRMKSRQAGFDEHFLKPVDLDVLLKLLDGLPLPGPAGASFPP
jgi:CheY-like chemotaxis protein